MCIDLSKPTFNAAVETVVNDLLAAGQSFSAHDVTTEVRRRVLAGTLLIDLTENGDIFISGVLMPRIEHAYVREAVHELYHQGRMTGFDRSNNGSYWLYEAAAVPVPIDDDAQLDADPPAQFSWLGVDTLAVHAPTQHPYDGTPTLISRLLSRIGLR